MKNIYAFLFFIMSGLMISSCEEDVLQAPISEGFLSFDVGIAIEESAASRTQTVNTDDFKVSIFTSDSVLVLDIPRLADAPDSISLPVGNYYAEASSNNQANAAFENPFYFGSTSIFSVNQGGFQSVVIDTELVNTQVSFVFSQNVMQGFDIYEGTVKVRNTSDSLFYQTGETRSGYFTPKPLDIRARIAYYQVDSTLVEKTFTASIDNPKPRTHYRLNLDATVENGQISIQINVDESVDVVDIDLLPSVITFQKAFGGSDIEEATTILQTLDGGFVISGHTFSSDGDVEIAIGGGDFWVVKTDVNGSIEWEKTFGGSRFDFAQDIAQAPDGTYGVIGTSNSISGPNGSLGNKGLNDIYFLKLGAGGNQLGDEMFGGSFNDQGHTVDVTNDGGYIIGGASESSNGDFSVNKGNLDLFIAEISPFYFGFADVENLRSLGGSEFETAESVLQTSDGGYIVAGRTSSFDGDVSGNGGYVDFWIVKFDRYLVRRWQSTIGGFDVDIANEIKETPDGGFIVAGFSKSSNGDVSGNQGEYDYWIVKLNSGGIIQWEKTYGGSGDDRAQSIDLTDDGGYVVAGFSNSTDGDIIENKGSFDFWVFKIDASGNMLWQNSLGGSGSDKAFSIKQTTDDGFIVAGQTSSSDGDVTDFKGASDIWMVKLDRDGNL